MKPFTRMRATQAYPRNGVLAEIKREAFQAGYEQAMKDLADGYGGETEDAMILPCVIDAGNGKLYNIK